MGAEDGLAEEEGDTDTEGLTLTDGLTDGLKDEPMEGLAETEGDTDTDGLVEAPPVDAALTINANIEAT